MLEKITPIFTRYKKPILIGCAILAAFFVYSYFFKAPAAPTSSLTTNNADGTSADGAPVVGADLLELLSQAASIKLDDSVFRDPVFVSLQDFGQNILPEPKGRNNPFAPLGSASN